MTVDHPYFPPHIHLPDYVPLVGDFIYVLGVFFVGVAAVFVATWAVSGRFKYLSATERLLACWFMVTGVIHFVIEGWVVANPIFYQDTTNNYLSDTWKEYGKADSRYLTRDSFIVGMEAVTAFVWGPLCPVIAYGILQRSAWRYTLALIVSLGQLYGDVLYFVTCHLEDYIHSRPEPLYFWFYFVFMNSIWIVIPVVVIAHCGRNINRAVAATPAPKVARARRAKAALKQH